LGAVIRGGTPHFEYVAGECVKGLSSVSLEFGIPVSFGVLTVDTIEQAIERAGTKAGNKGEEAAMSASEMVGLLQAMAAGFACPVFPGTTKPARPRAVKRVSSPCRRCISVN